MIAKYKVIDLGYIWQTINYRIHRAKQGEAPKERPQNKNLAEILKVIWRPAVFFDYLQRP